MKRNLKRKAKRYEVIPSARRLIRSLRDMGYDFSSAVADLVDNSIEARATVVTIDATFDGDDSWVRIADNGRGMSESTLKEAMRYGSERDYEDDDLGKFGLGLKTASLSQCQRLCVATRSHSSRRKIAAYCWDLDHIEKYNRWEIISLDNSRLNQAVREPLENHAGTVVLWQRLDRILGYKHPYGDMARKRFSAMCRDVEVHLAMVFHRFLAGEVPRKRLKILLNGNPITPWDPFARNEPKTKQLPVQTIELQHENVISQIYLEPFILPHQTSFSSVDAFRKASGPANWNQQQGFYIYRAGRLIQSGGWSRLRTADEHSKLARIALSFSPSQDDAFGINVSKMRVQLPGQIRDEVELAIRAVVRLAQKTYRQANSQNQNGASQSNAPANNPPNHASPAGPNAGNNTAQPGGTAPEMTSAKTNQTASARVWTLDELQAQLLETAKPEERAILSRVFTRFRSALTD